MPFQHLCVLGLGYIGLPTACTFATHGLRVTGVDVNPRVVETLRAGELHIHETGLNALVQSAVASGNLSVSTAPIPADAYIIAVPTPFFEDKRADLSSVVSAAESILPHLRRGSLVVLESTSPPRTTIDVVRPILERGGLRAGEDFHLCYSPERVLPGQILRELVENARVIGGIDPASAEAAQELYALFVRGEIVLTDATTAEMVKLMENTYRDISIAAANEFARLAERFGVNVWEAIALANRHPRIKILNPGPGVGGHCISVDPWFLVESAPDLAQLIRAAREVNDAQPTFVVAMLREALHGLRDKTVAALGLAYKPDVDDLRESPAVEVCRLLAAEGARVLAYEPFKPDAKIEGVVTVATLAETLDEADCLLLLVGHSAFLRLDPHVLAQLTKARIAVDCVNGWSSALWQEAGFHLYKLGDGKWRGRV
jgi:UDP-N-acetyl-D-mannosaminuronic acid dehydrogenase